jgi:hypothetical protein
MVGEGDWGIPERICIFVKEIIPHSDKKQNMDEDILVAPPGYKLYRDRPIYIATFLGGPLVAGYLIAENYRKLGERSKVWKTWLFTGLATILIFGYVFFIQSPDSPNYLVPIVYSLITAYLVKWLQGDRIKLHQQNMGEFYSWWRAVLVALIGAVITVAIAVIFLISTDTSKFF